MSTVEQGGVAQEASALDEALAGELAPDLGPIRVHGKFFFAGDAKHFVKGVTYGPFAVGTHGSQFPERAVVVFLDQRGETMSSSSFAGRLSGWRAENKSSVAFVIGGHDGLAPALREKADIAIAFGSATWPHQLLRIMLLEQIYRAVTILMGHPYHR